ncbi:hypothetical protein DP067_03630 [Mycoplasmopsis anatis]|uniref:Uncharacterized protein n=1 Tax=Mycoplasmopsis anatis 1340 TaxID=1034808 RepID=F9QE84_9BACT|nr:hypothetical protein [Mycoplasmopsis anatis]AWX70417.1 hypothetical protein DP067_03630 [Mycoplasmopsis anatis]EGS28895.1 hypothetical protein GIG_03467 [Mycoplasmopsis anatis 1340]VEU73927.1 Uncharacterised protein [Mycoplasmopsis anatis]
MWYSVEEIRENKDIINDLTLTVTSVYDALRKILSVVSDLSEEERDILTKNNINNLKETSKALKEFHKTLFSLIKRKKSNFTEEEMNKKFTYLELVGTTKDIKNLIELNIFSEHELNKIQKMSFKFEPFSGCNLPE